MELGGILMCVICVVAVLGVVFGCIVGSNIYDLDKSVKTMRSQITVANTQLSTKKNIDVPDWYVGPRKTERLKILEALGFKYTEVLMINENESYIQVFIRDGASIDAVRAELLKKKA